MKFSEAKQGRIFILRLEDGDIVSKAIEKFAAEKKIHSAYLIALGGADKSSKLVTGPENGKSKTIIPNITELSGVHEIVGTGTIFPEENNTPSLHMHFACGRKEETKTGCIRAGVKTWHIIEVILIELIDCSAKRLMDSAIGFKLLEP